VVWPDERDMLTDVGIPIHCVECRCLPDDTSDRNDNIPIGEACSIRLRAMGRIDSKKFLRNLAV